jgi:hypothetical protein
LAKHNPTECRLVLGFTLYRSAEASYNPTYKKDLSVNQLSAEDRELNNLCNDFASMILLR